MFHSKTRENRGDLCFAWATPARDLPTTTPPRAPLFFRTVSISTAIDTAVFAVSTVFQTHTMRAGRIDFCVPPSRFTLRGERANLFPPNRHTHHRLRSLPPARHLVFFLTAIDTTAFSVTNMFHPNMRALDVFGDKETSDSRRRCQPPPEDDDDAKLLFDLHLRVAVTYTVAYAGIQAMPYCFDELEAEMEGRGHPLSLVFDNETSVNTPWGLAKAYADEVYAFLDENDGWNADGSMSREYNRVPFSDFSMTDSAGNSYEPYTPVNTPYKVSTFF